MYQVTPNWTTPLVAGDFEKLFSNMGEFNGPGFYLSDTDTLLIVRDERIGAVEEQLPQYTWRKALKRNERFKAYVYNCVLAQTIFGVVSAVPVRRDIRSL